MSFFPTLTCEVFVFSSVSAPSFLSLLPHTLSHSLTRSLTHFSITHSPTHTTLTHSLTHSLPPSLTHPPTHARTHARTHSLTHSLTHTHTHTPHSLTHSLPRGRMYALASLWRPSGAVWSPPILRGRRGTNSPTITAQSTVSLELVTCGVIRSYNLVLIQYIQWLNYFLSSRSIG